MTETTRAELEEQRQFLLQSLRDLQRERDAGEIDEADYRSLHDDYTARAAAVLRELEELDPATATGTGRVRRRTGPPKHRARAAVPRARRPARTKSSRISPSMYIAGVVVAAIVGAGFAVVAFSTGSPREPAPRNALAGELEQAHQLESQNKASEALRAYDSVLEKDPNNVEALAYRGWLLGRAGSDAADAAVREELLTKAMESLDRAVAINPNYADARFFRGMVLFRFRNQPAPAIPEFEAYLASNPPANQATAVRNVLNEARQAAASSSPPPAG
ncbi:MAG: tetratricopeptide repeat protein [Actinomycetota bacterium]|nr:tetratricopeptide repeat protein [Actinomycetota bacterium]